MIFRIGIVVAHVVCIWNAAKFLLEAVASLLLGKPHVASLALAIAITFAVGVWWTRKEMVTG